MKIFSALVNATSSLVKRVFTGNRENVYIVDKGEKRGVAIELPHKFAAQVAKDRQLSQENR